MGLTSEEVIISRKKYGSNNYTKVKRKSFIRLLLETFSDPIIKILLIVLLIKIIFLFRDYDYFETIGILIAILFSSVISALSEYGSDSAFESLSEENNNIKVKVIRDNIIDEINSSEVVVDDILVVSSGDKIVADGIIIDGSISVNESSINGETKEKKKSYSNYVYSSSIVIDGEAKIRCEKVGDNTLIGKVALDIQENSPTSPLKIRLTHLAKLISIFGYIGSILVFIVYMLSTRDFSLSNILYALTLSVTVIVVSVPEGLPMMITLVLSSNMKRMIKDNVMVRRLVGIETSGNINVLLTDKTGTLTEGKLSVNKIITYDKEIRSIDDLNDKLLLEINNNIFYNNSSIISNNNVIGSNSTDKALLLFSKYNDLYNIKYREVFDSNKKYSLVKLNNDITYVKGASEVLLDKCNYYLDSLGNKKLLYDKDRIKKLIDKYSSEGIRVLMLASTLEDNISNLTYQGIVLIKDNLRDSSRLTINKLENAGINTIIVSGDSLNTVKSIAREIDILDDNSVCLTSEEFNKLSDEEIKDIYPRLKVIARSLPNDKSRLVKILEDNKLVVGMCGDGVNDASALRLANVGFAIGSGVEVAKEASDIIILDDDIKSIAKAILYGRTIFKSIRKFIVFQLTVNLCAMLISIIGPILNISSPVTVIQMLWINMIMDTLAGIAFSYEAPLDEYMKELPKNSNEKIINKYMIKQILSMGIYSALISLLFLKCNIFRLFISDNIKSIMTSYFALFVFMGIFNALNSRTTRINIFANIFRNKVFIIVFLLIFIIQLYLIYYGSDLFRTYGLTIEELIYVIILSLSVIPVNILFKLRYKNKEI